MKSVPVTIELPESVYANLLTVVKNCNLSHQASDGATTHGELDMPLGTSGRAWDC